MEISTRAGPIGHQAAMEHATSLSEQEHTVVIPSISSAKDGQRGFHFRERFIASTEDTPMIRTAMPSTEDVPRLLGQERALAISRSEGQKDAALARLTEKGSSTYSENQGWESPKEQCRKDAERLILKLRRIPTPSDDDAEGTKDASLMEKASSTYSEKDGRESQRIPTPSIKDASPLLHQDPQAGIPRGMYKWGLKWGGW